MFSMLVHFLKFMPNNPNVLLSEITSTDLINYKASLGKRQAWYLGSLSGLLQKWHALGYPGVTDDAEVLLRNLRVGGNLKGEAVLTMDPEQGPFTDIELLALQAALDRAFAEGELNVDHYLLAYLYMLLGQRSIQYAALKVRDVAVSRAKDGTPVYSLRVPRAKQRNQLSRETFKDRVIIPQVGELLVRYADEVCEQFADMLDDPADAPLFPAKQRRGNEPAGFKYHRTPQALAHTLKQRFEKLKVPSERTGKPIHITPTRFRRTIGTRAAAEGHGELIIAELLDHNDTQNVGVYVEAVPEMIERFDWNMAMSLATLAQAFAGTIIENESQATRAGDPSSRICDPRFDSSMKPLANCGKHGFCGFMAPIACYTCVSFEPWLDGPHEAVLDHLLRERERLLANHDQRIASINDRTILAVAEVIRRCEEIRKNNHG
ncbi:MAG: integrase [Hydrogenophilales bacterium 28-61-23]|nr:MAG: integrase [Hydrogenophilales bacterium 28-61-23]